MPISDTYMTGTWRLVTSPRQVLAD